MGSPDLVVPPEFVGDESSPAAAGSAPEVAVTDECEFSIPNPSVQYYQSIRLLCSVATQQAY